jgi:hypothetical protein
MSFSSPSRTPKLKLAAESDTEACSVVESDHEASSRGATGTTWRPLASTDSEEDGESRIRRWRWVWEARVLLQLLAIAARGVGRWRVRWGMEGEGDGID